MKAVTTPVVPVLQHDGATDRCGTFTPDDDSPPIVVVGSLVGDARIARLARRNGLDVQMLRQFARTGGPA